MEVRCKYAYGEQQDYFNHPSTVGFVRMGDEKHPEAGLALLLSNGKDGEKTMNVGKKRQGEIWYEVTGNRSEKITIDAEGNGTFPVSGGKLAVWVKCEENL